MNAKRKGTVPAGQEAGAAKTVRVWLYRDGCLLPDGYEARVPPPTAGEPQTRADEDAALVDALLAALEGVGCEVCLTVGEHKRPDRA